MKASSSVQVNYQFAAEPKAVQSRSKYRDPNEIRPSEMTEMANDSRIGAGRYSRPDHAASKISYKKNSQVKNTEEDIHYKNVYTELLEQPIQDESELVPDYYIDKPATPEYRPMHPGVEVATQIEDNELFDYVLEVEPILQVLVGKSLEQAQTELTEEDDKLEEMRRRMRFEKLRNAELMVTQRKEALHIRKQDEKKRREKQHQLRDEQGALAHQKFITRILSKNLTYGMKNTSLNILKDQGALRYSMNLELKREYLPYLLETITSLNQQHEGIQRNLHAFMDEITQGYVNAHAQTVQAEAERKRKVLEDKKAEEARLAAEKKHRRQRRKQIRQHLAKKSLLEKIQATALGVQNQEIENPFGIEITDILPTTKESLATIGGLIGELWLVLDALQEEQKIDIQLEDIVQVFVKLLGGEKYNIPSLPIYLREQSQEVINNVRKQMGENLILFNQNKAEKIEEIYNQVSDINHHQTLNLLSSNGLLDNSLFKSLNKALLYISLTSVDYKIPEPKQPEPIVPVAQSENKGEVEGEVPQEGEAKEPEEKPVDEEKTVEEQKQEEIELKIPEVTEMEKEILKILGKLNMNFVSGWELKQDLNGVIRFRVPLNRNPVVEGEQEEGEAQEEVQQTQQTQQTEQDQLNSEEAPAPIVEETQEDANEKIRKLILSDDFIEPFDGTTFEKEKSELPEQESLSNGFKAYNFGQFEGKNFAQINEKGQRLLRRELITLIKECIPAWNEVSEENILRKSELKSRANERVILNTLINNSEEIPIFDIEIN